MIKRYGLGIYDHDALLVSNKNGRWVIYDDVKTEIEQLQKDAREVARLLELGDQRLLANDGPCGGWNAAEALSPKESAKLYQACKRIAAKAAGEK